MADMMQFDLVSPERLLHSGEAASVQIPGVEGDMTAMPNHAPILTPLRPGVLVVDTGSEQIEFVVVSGMADVTPEGTSVLAEQAMLKSEASRELLEAALADLEAAGDESAAGQKKINDLKSLMGQLNL